MKSDGSEQGSSSKSYFVESSGSTLLEAFKNVNLKVSKEPYFAHVKVILFSEKVAREKMDAVVDFLIRNPNIRNIFVPIIAIEKDAKDILNSPTTENPVTSEAIRNMIETSKSYENIAIKQDFETFMDLYLDPRKDAYMNTVRKNGEAVELVGLGGFKGKGLKVLLDTTETGILNVLNNASYNHYVSLECPNKKEAYIIIDLYDNDSTKIDFKNNEMNVKSNLKASIISDECRYDFRNTSAYQELEEKFNQKIEEEYRKVFQKLRTYQTDLLKINETYYKSKRKELSDWYTYPINFEINVNINKNGLIFQVTNNE